MKIDFKKIKEIDFIKIVKESFALAWKKRYLWWFGFFITLGSLGSTNSSFDTGTTPEDKEMLEKVTTFVEANLSLVITIAIILVILFIFLFVLSIISRGGLIKTIHQELEGQKSSFKKGFKSGKKYFWKILGLSILAALFILGVIAVLAIPIVFLLYSEMITGMILLIILAILILIPILFLVHFLVNFGQLYLVLGDLSIRQSLENAYKLFNKNLFANFALLFTLLIVKIILFIGIIILAIPLVIIFVILGAILYFLTKTIGVIITVSIGVLVLLALFFVFRSFYEVFRQTVWIKFFQKIAKPKSTQEVLDRIAEKKLSASEAVENILG